MPSWEEIKAVLDSPYVPADKKNRMMDAYDRDTFNFNDEQEEYAKKYLEGYAEGDNSGWKPGFGDHGLQSAYDDAKADMDAGRAEEKQGTDAKDKASAALAALSPPASGGTGTRNSNDVLDLGRPACDFFCQWIDQIWNKRPSGGTLDYMKEIWGRYNRDRNIDFAKLLADTEDLTAAHKVNDETIGTAKTELNTLFTEWKGEGATAARVKFEEKIEPEHRKLQEHIDGAAKLVPQVTSAVFDAVVTKVDSVLGLYRTTVAHAPLEMANKVVKIARKETDKKSDLLDVAGWVDSVCGSDLSARLQSDDCALNDENRDYAYDLCAKWVAGSFTPEFQGLLDAFNGYCETAQSTIEQQWDALTGYLNGYHNEFTEPAATGQATPPARTGGGGGVTPAANGSGSGSLPAANGSGGGSAMPSVPPPSAEGTEDPATVAEAVKKESGEGTNPFTGKPLEIDPATGQPYPIDPATGQAVKDAGHPERLTVRQGDNEIEMSEPAKDGTMEIKIDDGHGGTRDFKLDWDGGPGQDTAGVVASPSGEKVYTPGPDGKIHIQDGGLTITAERPSGPDSATAVTVDDGTGRPATYTLGRDVHGPQEEQPPTAEAGAHQAVPGTPQASGFTAPGGIDIDHATASGTQASEVDGSSSEMDTPPAPEGADADQRTTAASFIDGCAADVPSGAGIVSGTLGDAGALEGGAQAGLFLPQPVEAAVGVAPEPISGQQAPVDHRAAIGGSGFGGGGMSPAMGGMLGFADLGEEPERSARAYRVDGGIFDTNGAGGRISGSLDDDDREVRF
ncbi:hypothetical protein [Amycolatopsis pigmentata]|uniref:WXG100 family type VII secretion target n=1 Tax=Amycolatopsis pigmentata TaxID=450801 RepID=A0ABW5G5C1_9PSEU